MRSSDSSHSKPPLPLHSAIRNVHKKVLLVKPPPYPLDRPKPRKLKRFRVAHDLLSKPVEPTSVSWRSVIDGLEAQLVLRILHVGHWCYNLFRSGVQPAFFEVFREPHEEKAIRDSLAIHVPTRQRNDNRFCGVPSIPFLMTSILHMKSKICFEHNESMQRHL